MNQSDFELKFFKPYPNVKKLAIDMGYVLLAPLAFTLLTTACILISGVGLALTLLSPLLLIGALPFGFGMAALSHFVNRTSIESDNNQSQIRPCIDSQSSTLRQFAKEAKYHLGQSMHLAFGIALCALLVSALTLFGSLLSMGAILLSPFVVGASIASCLYSTGVDRINNPEKNNPEKNNPEENDLEENDLDHIPGFVYPTGESP